MPDNSEERALRDAALRGDEHAWRVLFDRHADAAYRYAYVRVGRHRERAEEATQEAWMIAVKKLSGFDPARAPFGAWFRGILTRVLANQRRRWAIRDASEAPLDGREPANDTGPDGNEVLARAFTELPPDYQDAIHAKYIEGFTMREIADHWRRTPKAVESLLSRARIALREAYSAQSATEEKSSHD